MNPTATVAPVLSSSENKMFAGVPPGVLFPQMMQLNTSQFGATAAVELQPHPIVLFAIVVLNNFVM